MGSRIALTVRDMSSIRAPYTDDSSQNEHNNQAADGYASVPINKKRLKQQLITKFLTETKRYQIQTIDSTSTHFNVQFFCLFLIIAKKKSKNFLHVNQIFLKDIS